MILLLLALDHLNRVRKKLRRNFFIATCWDRSAHTQLISDDKNQVRSNKKTSLVMKTASQDLILCATCYNLSKMLKSELTFYQN